MADAFDEVEQELRQDRYRILARRYGPIGLAAMAAILIGVGAQEFLTWRGEQKAAAAAESFTDGVEAFERERFGQAREIFADLSQSGPRGYRALARMEEAAAALAAGDAAQASTLYEEAAGLTNDPVFRDLARLRSVLASADDAEPGELQAVLEPLARDDGPYRHIAREFLAAEAFEAGDIESARNAYRVLSLAPDAPQGVRGRANQALALIDVASAAAGEENMDDEDDEAAAAPGETSDDDPIQQEDEG